MKKGLKVVCFIANNFEDLELWYPVLRLREAGVTVHLVGEKAGEKYIGKYGVPATSDYAFGDIAIEDYDALLVPGRLGSGQAPAFSGSDRDGSRNRQRKQTNRSDLPRRLGSDFRKNTEWKERHKHAGY